MSQATLEPRPYLNSNLFSGHYLDNRLADLDAWDCDDEASAVFDVLRERWLHEGDLVESYNEDDLLDKWIDEVLDALGFETLNETTLPDGGGHTDRLLFESREKRHEASVEKSDGHGEAAFALASAVLEAKQWNADFTARFSETRSYRDASHQIKYYLEKTPEAVEWGVLTDGRKWRLYGTKDYATETYYEVDLPELLASGDLEAFKYFYVFFRPEAFHETAGTTFLDRVWNESETAAKELGEDLQDNVFTALRLLGEGFLESNDLDVDTDDAAALAELKEQSLVLLYRLMFVLYAESRDLIHPEPGEADEFRDNFSLDQLRVDVHERLDSGHGFDDYSDRSTGMWTRLGDLFRLVDSGDDDLGIPPYNGGLFDDDRHEFLAEHVVTDRYVAEVVYRLGTTESEDGSFVLADYADLDTRHLGSIYEGLLEHEFRIAPEEYAAVAEDGGQVWKPATEVSVADSVEEVAAGDLYVVNDDGERKATGAYYTPDYVVTYIVEETIDPLISAVDDELRADGLEPGDRAYFQRFWQAVLDLKVLDPAMGSGHFLTKATGYLTERVMAVVREQEIQSYDEQDLRRDIAKECIYGVDVNGMAVELAKLSMWLETLAADSPLAFLDHHVKHGNSLVGSDIAEVLSDDAEENGGQLTLAQSLARIRERTLGHVMDLMRELLAIDNENLADVKSMEELYDEIRSDPLYRRLFELANVHTAERFGLDVPEGAYESMAQAIEDEAAWAEIRERDWFRAAQATAAEETFFHWELEFPEVFFGDDGGRREDGGFDAVVGNPPYVKIQNIRNSNPSLGDYASHLFSAATGRFDLYGLFVERGVDLSSNGRLGYILPNKFFESQAGRGLRKLLAERNRVDKIVNFNQLQVFDGATTYTSLLFLGSAEEVEYGEVKSFTDGQTDLRNIEFSSFDANELDENNWILVGPIERQAMKKMQTAGKPLSSITEFISEGIVSGDNDVMFVDVEEWGEETHRIRSPANEEVYVVESDVVHPLIDGDEIERYGQTTSDRAVIYPYRTTDNISEEIPEEILSSRYPQTYRYLSEFRDRLADRGTESMNYPKWYSLWCPREKPVFDSQKLVVPDICQRSEFTIDSLGGIYLADTAYSIVPKQKSEGMQFTLLAILNSSIVWFYLYHTSPILRGDFRRFKTSYLSPVPIVDSIDFIDTIPDLEEELGSLSLSDVQSPERVLPYLAAEQISHHHKHAELNLSLIDYFGSYRDGQTLAEAGFAQPPEGSADSIIQQTTEQKPNLKVGRAEVSRDSPTSVEIRLTARYKPEDESEHETDSYGYTETEPLPALKLTDLTETEADLIEAFVPYAVNEAGGFADFRKNATKTNSLVDRLRVLTLPRVEDVRDGLASYRETVARAEELETKIERTDRLIDEIVYELYGLTDEEIEIVEAAVGD